MVKPFYWPEPGALRGQRDGTDVVVTGLLAYVHPHTSRQGRPYATGVLRLADGEIPIEVLPMPYARMGARIVQGITCTVTGRVDRRGRLPRLVVTDVAVELDTLADLQREIRERWRAAAGADLVRLAYDVSNWLDEHNGCDRGEMAARIMKVGEELGETIAAWIAATGQNPRKGPASGDFTAVGAELADVVMTALVAIASLGLDVEEVITDCTTKIADRVNGSAPVALIGENGSLGRKS